MGQQSHLTTRGCKQYAYRGEIILNVIAQVHILQWVTNQKLRAGLLGREDKSVKFSGDSDKEFTIESQGPLNLAGTTQLKRNLTADKH